MSGGDHKRKPNGILGLLCKEHFPGLMQQAGMLEPAYTWDHYIAFRNVPDWDEKVFANKAERVMAELWVSHPSTTLLNTSYTLDILEIMTGYITSLCRISSDARRDMRLGQLM